MTSYSTRSHLEGDRAQSMDDWIASMNYYQKRRSTLIYSLYLMKEGLTPLDLTKNAGSECFD